MVGVGGVLLLTALASAMPRRWELEHRDFGFLSGWMPPPRDLPELELMELPEWVTQDPGDLVAPPDLSWLRFVVIAGAAIAVALLVAWLVRRFAQSAAPVRTPAAQEPGVAGLEEPDIPALQRGVAIAQRVLDEGADPRNAIIAAWLALEHAAADSGVRKAASQTPTEFAMAVLDRTEADTDATVKLLRLYRQARFSRRPPTRSDVAEAVRCLTVLADGWDSVPATAEVGP
jgi:hypothetical protein